jgi:BirA family transcriptional regulator, biotin operon repressor / biotin---[acetyl-CoA-carboxylase] ligase
LNPDLLILRQLFQAQPDTIYAPLLAQHCGLNEKQLFQRIQDLTLLGYDIEIIPHQGCRLRQAPDILIADEILAHLADVSAPSVMVFKETKSTNDLAHRQAREGHPGPLVIIAETQTQGRGRQGRSWSSAPGLGLWLSFLLRPENLRPSQAQRLTIQTCLALRRAVLKVCQIHLQIKWPNDLLLKGKKVAGILTETHIEKSTLHYAVIGVGLNVNHGSEDFPPELRDKAASLRHATTHPFRRVDILVAFLKEFSQILNSDWNTLREEWKSHCLNMGQPITLHFSGQTYSGQMIDLDSDGSLIFRHGHGKTETFHAAEIIS